MKKFFRSFIPVLVTLSLILTGCSASAEKADRKKVVAEINGEKILKGEFLDAYASEKAAYGITEEIEANEEYKEDIANLKKGILENLVYEKLISQKVKEAGLKVTDEISKQAKEQFDSMLKSIEEQMKAQETGESTEKVDYAAKAKEFVDEQLKTIGKTQSEYIKTLAENIITQQFVEKTIGEIQVTDDEIKIFYDEQLKAQKEGGAPASEELDLVSEADVVVKHILIMLPEAEQTEYKNLIAASKTEEAKKYLEEKLKGIYPKAKQILDRVKKGEDFEKLLAEFGEDPGMTAKTGGYSLVQDGPFIPEFERASKALKEGKVSELVGGPYGYHIIKAYKVVPEKITSLEEKKDILKDSLISKKGDAKWATALKDWMEKSKVTKYEDLL